MQKGFSLILVLVTVLTISSIILGVILVPNLLHPVSTQPLTLPPLVSPSSSSVPAEKSLTKKGSVDRKTYTNTKYGYQIKYPSSWVYEENLEYDYSSLYPVRLPKEVLDKIQKDNPLFLEPEITIDILERPFTLPGSPDLYGLYLIKPMIIKVDGKEGVYSKAGCAPDCGIEFEYPYQEGNKILRVILRSPGEENIALVNKQFNTNIQDIDQETFKRIINTLEVLE